MYTAHAKSGQVIDLRPLGKAVHGTKAARLVKTAGMEIFYLAAAAGGDFPSDKVSGEIVVQCLEGRMAATYQGASHAIEPGQLIYLASGAPRKLRAIDDASLLVTRLVAECEPVFDVVEEASEESFPASDPPATW